MLPIEVEHVYKSYGSRAVVDDVSFSVGEGEIFGLIGPNGAGKTTTLRMILDIIKPDRGEVRVLGERLTEVSKSKIGYLPEERGLYRKLRALDTIVYLATLKGMSPGTARRRGEELLRRVNMLPHRNKKIEEMSRGMAQLIQFLSTIIHEPRVVIIDEPFTGLDPVNTELLKEMILELRTEGKAVIMSTHRMNEVEALSNRILMINRGRAVLYGGLAEIKSRFRSNSVLLECEGEPGEIAGVTQKPLDGAARELVLGAGTTPQQVLEALVSRGVKVNRFEVATPTLNEIFIKVAGEEA